MSISNVVAEHVRKEWEKRGYSFNCIAYFEAKYEWEENYTLYEELIMSDSDTDLEMVYFDSDFDEGQQMIKDIIIVDLSVITGYYTHSSIFRKKV